MPLLQGAVFNPAGRDLLVEIQVLISGKPDQLLMAACIMEQIIGQFAI